VTPAVRQKARSLIDCVIQSLICAVAYCFRGTCNGGSPGNVLPVDGRSGGEWLAPGSHVRRGGEWRAPALPDPPVLGLRKALPRMKIRVEAADERFVRSSEPTHDGLQTGFDHLRVLALQFVIYQHDGRERESFHGEKGKLLLHIVVKNAKFAAGKIR